MSATLQHVSDPSVLLLTALVVVLAVGLPVAVIFGRRLAPQRARRVAFSKRLDLVVRDLDRLADTPGEVSRADTQAWQSYRHGLAALTECHWEEAIKHLWAAQGMVTGAQLVPLFHQAGVCHYMEGRLGGALKESREAARLAEQCEDLPGRVLALNNIAVIEHESGELDEALAVLRQARGLARQSFDRAAEAFCLANIGNILRENGAYGAALQAHEESLALSRQVGDRKGIADCTANIAGVLRDRGEVDKAIERYAAAVAAARKVNHKLGAAVALGNLGCLYLARGDVKRALEHHESALALAREIGFRLGVVTELANIGLLNVGRRAYEQAVTYLVEPLTYLLEAGVANGHRQALYGLSKCDDALGRKRMQELLWAGMAKDAAAEILDRIDQIRIRRPWQLDSRQNPFAPAVTAVRPIAA
jgi:tetratricopeptide (TPR) repeat protein